LGEADRGLARPALRNYAFAMHNHAAAARPSLYARPRLSSRYIVRHAGDADVEEIAALVNLFADGRTLPRSVEQVALAIDSYVVAVDANGRVAACAALEEYSPSLGEVASVAVRPRDQGKGLGSAVVQGVERIARARGIRELFAMSLVDEFFGGLGYARTAIARYPEKLARYSMLAESGVAIVEKRCFRKRLGRGAAVAA
jgi:amino-acid N-acetyltransferase